LKLNASVFLCLYRSYTVPGLMTAFAGRIWPASRSLCTTGLHHWYLPDTKQTYRIPVLIQASTSRVLWVGAIIPRNRKVQYSCIAPKRIRQKFSCCQVFL